MKFEVCYQSTLIIGSIQPPEVCKMLWLISNQCRPWSDCFYSLIWDYIVAHNHLNKYLGQMSCNMIFPTMWYVRPAKAQTSLRISAVWSEPLLVAWIFYECLATDRTSFEVPKLKRRLHRPVWVYTCQNATMLEISCHASNTARVKPIF